MPVGRVQPVDAVAAAVPSEVDGDGRCFAGGGDHILPQRHAVAGEIPGFEGEGVDACLTQQRTEAPGVADLVGDGQGGQCARPFDADVEGGVEGTVADASFQERHLSGPVGGQIHSRRLGQHGGLRRRRVDLEGAADRQAAVGHLVHAVEGEGGGDAFLHVGGQEGLPGRRHGIAALDGDIVALLSVGQRQADVDLCGEPVVHHEARQGQFIGGDDTVYQRTFADVVEADGGRRVVDGDFGGGVDPGRDVAVGVHGPHAHGHEVEIAHVTGRPQAVPCAADGHVHRAGDFDGLVSRLEQQR